MFKLKHMKTKHTCPHCGKEVIKSDSTEYTYQCLECDEDFYKFEEKL